MKRTILVAVLLITCILSATVGGTVAWFTDKVETANNIITAGDLDVEVTYKNKTVTTETPVTEATNDLFSMPELWEPGAVAYADLTVKNVGTLAFNYNMSIKTNDENAVVDGEDKYPLSDALKVAFISKDGINLDDRAEVLAAAKNHGTEFEAFSKSGSLLPGTDTNASENGLLVVYWEPGENDNRWNLNNNKTLDKGDALYIKLGLVVEATQMMSEADSFGDDYDKAAAAGAVIDSLYSGNSVQLATDIVADKPLVVPANAEITIDLAGNNMDLISGDPEKDGIVVGEGATLNLIDTTGNGSIDITANDGKNAITVNGGTLNIETKVNLPGNENAIVADSDNPSSPAIINIKEGANISASAENSNAISLQDNAVGYMTDGVIKAAYDPDTNTFGCATAISLDSDSAVFNMSGGEIWVLGYHGASGISTTMRPNANASGTINITGGTINVQSDDASGYMLGVEAAVNSKLSISGVTINVAAKNAVGAAGIYTTGSVDVDMAKDVKINVQTGEGYAKNWAVADWDDVDLSKEYVERTGSFKVGGEEYSVSNYNTIFDGIINWKN